MVRCPYFEAFGRVADKGASYGYRSGAFAAHQLQCAWTMRPVSGDTIGHCGSPRRYHEQEDQQDGQQYDRVERL